MNCEICGERIPPARLAILPETRFCVKCAAVRVKKKVGFMVSGSSKGTASELVTVDPDDKESMRRAENAHRRKR